MVMASTRWFDQQDLFIAGQDDHYRIPSLAYFSGGTLLAFANRRINTPADSAVEVHIVVRRSVTGGHSWESPIEIFAQNGWHAAIGAAVVDPEKQVVFLPYNRDKRIPSGNSHHVPEDITTGDCVASSRNRGVSWKHAKMNISPDYYTYRGSTHGASPGIILRSGCHKGRLILPARYSNKHDQEIATLQGHHHNGVVFSDDHGQTWHMGGAVQMGTGEGGLAELDDGSIYYNSRAYFLDGKRRIAWSYDGGKTFTDFSSEAGLTEPVNGGCNAGVAKYPVELSKGKNILLFSNPAGNNRAAMTVKASIDGGRTWPVARRIYPGPCAYSAMVVGDDGTIYLLYENGTDHPYEKISLARFTLDWVMMV